MSVLTFHQRLHTYRVRRTLIIISTLHWKIKNWNNFQGAEVKKIVPSCNTCCFIWLTFLSPYKVSKFSLKNPYISSTYRRPQAYTEKWRGESVHFKFCFKWVVFFQHFEWKPTNQILKEPSYFTSYYVKSSVTNETSGVKNRFWQISLKNNVVCHF